MREKDWSTLIIKYEKYLLKPWWGFMCDDGWYELIDNTLSKIIDWYKENYPEDLEINEDGYTDFCIMQIKEKYGTLRIYIGGSYEEVFNIIYEAEKVSAETCEICGNSGRIREVSGWYKCVCEDHYKEWSE